ncbi:TPA: rhodanese-like domain-containing protein [Streptococcus equi subsp. zooepidemicus]|uniref:rhodanese-like domain-containing protein n=1 Tax=Streptococcus equi TaxID=1336 RepID=UPI0013F64AE7|nr:rhodanese-like domain-containing protein [Streptococcus equi]MCD3407045.1 rhodanese-like domain-containing protein [Streptococcus equi subsp. zooepidemicus]MDI5899694.1 rhodanese-like domain-containing protein [Streptococcus equi subsp. zooepidemicus]MDI5957253.1 rhodanese-like domain-containing protein [Streptococcus equi subsp. zooepidemicus]MDI5959232.1 rhodanese-like domain-containing protein [Streptococcus equi subsp. zooepidemicus]MDI6088118.1 rhodanese-like domain-containing protein 
MSPLTMIGWVLLAGVIAYYLWNYVSYRRMAKQVDNDTFKELMRQGQVIDLRDPASFRARHILGARNFPTQQFAASIKALRKDKPILLYENVRPQYRVKAVKTLRKAGYTDLYVLKAGLDYWNGKVK